MVLLEKLTSTLQKSHLCFPWSGVTAMFLHSWHFCGFWGIQTQVLAELAGHKQTHLCTPACQLLRGLHGLGGSRSAVGYVSTRVESEVLTL